MAVPKLTTTVTISATYRIINYLFYTVNERISCKAIYILPQVPLEKSHRRHSPTVIFEFNPPSIVFPVLKPHWQRRGDTFQRDRFGSVLLVKYRFSCIFFKCLLLEPF